MRTLKKYIIKTWAILCMSSFFLSRYTTLSISYCNLVKSVKAKTKFVIHYFSSHVVVFVPYDKIVVTTIYTFIN